MNDSVALKRTENLNRATMHAPNPLRQTALWCWGWWSATAHRSRVEWTRMRAQNLHVHLCWVGFLDLNDEFLFHHLLAVELRKRWRHQSTVPLNLTHIISKESALYSPYLTLQLLALMRRAWHIRQVPSRLSRQSFPADFSWTAAHPLWMVLWNIYLWQWKKWSTARGLYCLIYIPAALQLVIDEM